MEPFTRLTRARVVVVLMWWLVIATVNAGDQTRRVRVGGDVPRPKQLHRVYPPYPEKARQQRIEGEVVFEIVVSTEGNVIEAKVTKKLEPTLDEAALSAVKMWRYEGTKLDGQPVEVIMPESLRFTLPK
jgi:TonB family protein